MPRCSGSYGHPDEHTDQSEEAVKQVDGYPPLLEPTYNPRGVLHDDSHGLVEPMPEMVLDRHPVLGRQVVCAGKLATHAEQRFENLPDRLPKALGGVLHARGLPRIAAIPGRRAP